MSHSRRPTDAVSVLTCQGGVYAQSRREVRAPPAGPRLNANWCNANGEEAVSELRLFVHLTTLRR